MLCDEVIRELAVPTDDRDATALAEHLAACPTCSDWAGRMAQIDRLWEATRPAEPSSEAWGAVWNQITRSLDRPETTGVETIAYPLPSTNGSHPLVVDRPAPSPTHPVPRPGRGRLAMIALFGLAQAAAVLLAVGLAWPAPLEIEEGQTVVIRMDGPAPEKVILAPDVRPYSADPWYLMYNAMESGPNPQVAMKE